MMCTYDVCMCSVGEILPRTVHELLGMKELPAPGASADTLRGRLPLQLGNDKAACFARRCFQSQMLASAMACTTSVDSCGL